MRVPSLVVIAFMFRVSSSKCRPAGPAPGSARGRRRSAGERFDSVAKRDRPYQQSVTGARSRLGGSAQIDIAGTDDLDRPVTLEAHGAVRLDAVEGPAD